MLLLDAATPLAQAGIWRDGEWLGFASSRGGAEQALFAALEECLRKAGMGVGDVDGFVFCEGPGSMLGVRIATMAIRGWQSLFKDARPVFSYYSLEAAARSQRATGEIRPLAVVSDARRGFWNVFLLDEGDAAGRLERWPSERVPELPQPVFRLEEPRKTPCPVEAAEADYDFAPVPGIFCDSRLVRSNVAVEAYTPVLAEFKKWTPERHR